MSNKNTALLLSLLLLIVFICFSPALTFDFINWDDPFYVFQNPLMEGFSWNHIQKAFSSTVMSNYQPLVTLSLGVDYYLFGLEPAGFHFTNILFHLLNVALVFSFINLLNIPLSTSFLIAFLFALHPLRVESVAWITERKDVLYLFFYLCALHSYLFSLREGKRLNHYYVLCVCFFILSALCKPAAVSFPFILLLLDWKQKGTLSTRDLINKIPFFLLSGALGAATTFLYSLPFDYEYLKTYTFSSVDHFFMGFYSLMFYGYKLLWPVGLTGYYPYPEKTNDFLPMIYYFSPLIVCAAIALIYKSIHNKIIFIFGMSLFALTVFPNLAFFNFGNVIAADRYTYLPSVGFFLVVVQIIQERLNHLKDNRSYFRSVLIGLLIFILITIPLQTFRQLSVWKNSGTFWTRVLTFFPNETMAHYNRGNYYASIREFDKAIEDYSAVIAVNPKDSTALNNRGNMYLLTGQDDKALTDYQKSISLYPAVKNYLNRAEYYRINKNYEAALRDIEHVLQNDPQNQAALKARALLIETIQ
jgi:tetratricopeptide (TPR) repeat protein